MPEELDGIDVARGTRRAAVFTDDQAIVAGLLNDIGQVVRDFAGNIHTLIASNIYRAPHAPEF